MRRVEHRLSVLSVGVAQANKAARSCPSIPPRVAQSLQSQRLQTKPASAGKDAARHTEATRIGRTVGQPGRLSFPEFCKVFGWRDPKHALIYVNPTAAELAQKL